MTFVEDNKTDFIQGRPCDRYRDHHSGILQWKKEIGLNMDLTDTAWASRNL